MSINHGAGEYVRGQVQTNGIEPVWVLLERGYKGIFHQLSVKHLHRYVNEFTGRLNMRNRGTINMMKETVSGMVETQLTYQQLVA